MGDGGWEREAENWIRWARTPGHDAYWYYRDAFFDAIVPHGGGRALEVGCGEGRVARDLCTHGHRVTGLDASPTLVRGAREADGFVIECLREPAASERSVAAFGRSEIRLQRIPLFLHIRARHHSA